MWRSLRVVFVVVSAVIACRADPFSDLYTAFGQGAGAVDSAGNVYVAGSTKWSEFPTSPNAFQKNFTHAVCGYINTHGIPNLPIECDHGYVVKLDSTGKILYSTLLQGNQQDLVSAMAVDRNGYAYVTGHTSSSDFPVTPGAYASAGSGFVTKLKPDGSGVVFSTRLPGDGAAIALDPSGNIYVTGPASENDFPTTPGAFQSKRYVGERDVFVLKLSPDGSKLLYSTLIGGTFADVATAIAVDSGGSAYVAGYTASTPAFAYLSGPDYAVFPITPGAFTALKGRSDVFIARLNPDASALVYSAVFGGTGDDGMGQIALGPSGSVYFVGSSPYSPDFPTTPGAFQPNYRGGFVGRLSSDGSRLIYSTYLGTERGASVSRIAVDASGRAFVTGTVYQSSFPTTPDADQVCFPSDSDWMPTPFYAQINAAGSALLHASYSANTIVALDSAGRYYTTSSTQLIRRIDPAAPVSAAVRCVANAASFRASAVAPGEIVSLFGPGIGPEEPAIARPDPSGKMPTTLSGMTVLVNGVAAPLLYVAKNQINAVVPFSVAEAAEAKIQVGSRWFDLPPFIMPVKASAAAAFTIAGSGYGQVAAINEDGTLNGPEHPAPQGSIVALWLTGFGAVQPALPDGVIGSDAISKTVLQPVVRIGGNPDAAEVTYCGQAPGLVAGAVQLNVRIPKLFETGQVQFFIELGGSGAGGLLAVK